MKLNRQAFNELLQEDFKGNYNAFSQKLEVDQSHLHRYLTAGIGGGKKIIGALLKYCKTTGKDFSKYIITSHVDPKTSFHNEPKAQEDLITEKIINGIGKLTLQQKESILTIIEELHGNKENI